MNGGSKGNYAKVNGLNMRYEIHGGATTGTVFILTSATVIG